jgi:hypothetical protein
MMATSTRFCTLPPDDHIDDDTKKAGVDPKSKGILKPKRRIRESRLRRFEYVLPTSINSAAEPQPKTLYADQSGFAQIFCQR